MRLPDPIANTTTEAYLAYKAGVLEESELKPKLYYPTDHFDAWLAKWAGLTIGYPINNLGKNLFNITSSIIGGINGNTGDVTPNSKIVEVTKTDTSVVVYSPTYNYKGIVTDKIAVSEGEKLTLSWGRGEETTPQYVSIFFYDDDDTFLSRGEQIGGYDTIKTTATAPSGAAYARCAMEVRDAGDTVTFYNIMVEKSASATSFEPYSGEPEMLTDEEALVAYLAGITDTYPDSVKDPYDVRIAGYLRYLVSARFGRPEYPVNNEELYLSMLKPPVVANSTPSSDIELVGTCEAPFVDAKIYGDTKQNSYTGKNLFDPKILDYTAGLRFEFVEGDIIHIYGTPTAEWIAVTSNYNAGANMIDIPAGTTLSYASIVTGTGIASQAMRVRHSSAPNDSTDDLSNGTRTKTTTKDNNYMMFWIRCTIGTLVDAYIHIQVTASDTPDYNFEPFTGAIPSPSEFYPQIIETVTGHQSVRAIGSKNLFDKNKYLALDGYVDANDRIVHTTNQAKMVAIRCAPNTTYTVSKTAEGAQPRFFVFTTTSLPEYTMTISNKVGTNTGADTHTSYTITTGPDDEWLGVFLKVGSTEKTLEEILDTLQIEEGEVATEYTEYSGREYEINLGKNIADMSTYNYGNILADGTITDSTDFCRSNMFQIEEGSRYTVWADVESETDKAIRIAFYDGHKQFLRRWSLTPDQDGSAVSVGAPEDASYIMVAFCIRNGMHRLQIEAGDTFTGYADYFEPIKLGELEGKSDYIFRDDDGTWKIHRETFSGVLDGSADENWYVSGGAFKCNNLSQDAIVNPTLTYPSLGWGDMSADYYSYNYPSSTHGKMGEAYCSGFIPTKSWNVVAGSGASHFGLAAINTAGGNSAIYIGSIHGVTIAQFREYLAADPIEVRYVLKTPYDEEITNQALIAQLDAFMNGGSDDGQTEIEVSAPYPELMAKLKIEAGEYR